jgi:TonB family protein
LHLRAVVRVLVTRAGSPAVPRLVQSSGHASFDRCALRYVLALHFSAGTDAHGSPLDVWMNVQVAPVTSGQLGDVN